MDGVVETISIGGLVISRNFHRNGLSRLAAGFEFSRSKWNGLAKSRVIHRYKFDVDDSVRRDIVNIWDAWAFTISQHG